MKRFLALCLILGILTGMLPSALAVSKEEDVVVYTEDDYVTADLMWEDIHATQELMENRKATAKQTTEAIVSQITSSAYYAEGSLTRNGEYIFWETVDGIPCGYSPRLARIGKEATPLEGYDVDSAPTVLTSDYSKRGGYPQSTDVYLIQPYYGIDSSFTEQYEEEAENIAQATGGTATIYRTTSATIDAIADAMEEGAVVIFDSHGDTDYTKGEDYVSQANSSYLCLQTGTGLTSEDYTAVTGNFGTYYHAFYGGSYKDLKYYCVDGTAIANHMEKKAQNSLLWMAICLGMATEGLHAPLRSKGVEVVYGYSQSVTFDYDYLWEEAFWSRMKAGATVADAISYMKDTVGLWDWCHSSSYDTITEAREKYCAFPIVVSSEDVYPGHGNVDDLQTVKSTYTVLAPCTHATCTAVAYLAPTCTADGNIAYYRCNSCGAMYTNENLEDRLTPEEILIPATGHSFDTVNVIKPATCIESGTTVYTCTTCSYSYTSIAAKLGHNFVSGFCSRCSVPQPVAIPFAYGDSGSYIIAAKVNGVYYAMPNAYTTTSTKFIPITIQLTDGYVAMEDTENVALQLIYNASLDQYLIYNGTYYLKYPSSTNLCGTTSEYYWTLEKGTNGSWRFVSGLNATRALIYRAGSYQYFGSYYIPNVTAGGKEYYDVEILPIGQVRCDHVYDQGVITTYASCTADGVKTYTCTVCGYKTTESIPAIGHSFEVTALTHATCTTEGTKTYTCSHCGETTTESIPAIGHSFEVTAVTHATCTTEGTRTYTCSHCGETTTESIPAKDHNWEDVIVTHPTCIADGSGKIYCTDCEEYEVYTIPSTGEHHYVDRVCEGCGDVLPPEPILLESMKLGHTLNLASDISINYAVRTALLQGYDSYYLEITMPVYSGNGTTEDKTITIAPTDKGNYTYFTLTGITAVQMADDIRGTLYLTKGENVYYTKEEIYSVATYAYSQLSKPENTQSLKKLCAELLRYGAWAQTYKGYRTDSLADGELTEEYRSYLTDLNSVTISGTNYVLSDLNNPSVKWVSKTLNLESKIGIKFIVNLSNYTGNIEDLELRYRYQNYKGETVTGVVSRAELYHEPLKYYSFQVDSLLASELRCVITAEVYCNDVRVSESTVYSPETYAIGRTGDLLTLCQAMLSYSDTALAFFKEN